MAIAIGNTSSGNGENVSNITISHTIATGSDRLLLVAVTNDGGAPSSVEYGGVAMTLLEYYEYGGATRVYYLKNPTVGTANIVVSWSGSSYYYPAVFCADFTGVDQTTTFRTVSEGGTNGTSASISPTSQVDDLVIDFFGQRSTGGGCADPTAGTGVTDRGTSVSPSSINRQNLGTRDGQSGSTTMAWSWSGGCYIQQISFALIPKPPSVDVTVSATVVSATFSIPASTVTGGATVSPSAQVLTASIPAYTIEAIRNNTETPSVQVLSFSIPAYSVSGDSNVAVNTQVATFSIPAYFVEAGNVLITPSVQVLTFSIPAYGVDVVANITVSPSAQVLTFSIPSYSVSVDANITVTPSAQVLTASIPTYTISVEANVSVSAGVQVMTFSIPSYSPSGSAIASPSAQVLTFSIPTYTITNIANITISQGVLSLSLSIPTFGITADYWQNKFDPITTNWSDKY